jgi:hypothetical protein
MSFTSQRKLENTYIKANLAARKEGNLERRLKYLTKFLNMMTFLAGS